MNNVELSHRSETLPATSTSPRVCLPQLSLPQVTPAQVIAKRQHSNAPVTHFQSVPPQTPFLQTPVTPPIVEPTERQAVLMTKKEVSSVSLSTGPQLSFPIPRPDFSHSLRTGVTYIPRSMPRHEEPNLVDALIACATLILLALFIVMLLYFFSM